MKLVVEQLPPKFALIAYFTVGWDDETSFTVKLETQLVNDA